MKRLLKILTVTLCVVLLCCALVGCDKLLEWMDKTAGKETNNTVSGDDTPDVTTLDTPVMSLKDNIIKWNAVTGAGYYRVKCVNQETGEPRETLVRVPELDPHSEVLALPAGRYLIVVRAEPEANDTRYQASAYVADDKGIIYTIEKEVDLTEVTFEAYRVDATTVLCTWSEIEGADVCHVTAGDVTADSREQFVLLSIDATKNQQFVLTVTGKAGYPYAGKEKVCDYVALSAKSVDTASYDKKDEELSFGILNAEKVEWDGKELSQTFSGLLTLGAEMLREQTIGRHYMRATAPLGVSHVLVHITDTRPPVFVNDAGGAITEIDYVLSRDLSVNMLSYANTIDAVTYDSAAVPAQSYTLNGSQLTIALAYLAGVGEGDHVLRIAYTTVQETSSTVSLTVHASVPTIPTYDVASGTALNINGIPAGVTGVMGGSIKSTDYTMNSTTLTLKADYLATLHAGTYTYWLQGANGVPFSLNVINTACAPYGVILSYDDHPTKAYGHYHCDCGDSLHSYTLDGGTRRSLDGETVDLGTIDKSAQHTLMVYCDKNGTSAGYTIRPTDKAANYFNQRYSFEGRNPDCYVGSLDEFVDVARYLSYGGNINYEKGDYGVSELNVFVDANVIKTDDTNAVLNMLLTEANGRFASPYGCSMLLSGTFDSSTHTCELTVTVAFTAAIPKSYVNGIAADSYVDARPLLSANATPRTTYIEGVTKTENVGNVQELADLPVGVRPIFSGLDQATTLAKATYDAAVDVCKTYIRDSMTDIQKVQVFFDYMSRFVTYDYFALVWYEISDRDRILEYNQYVAFHNAAVATNQWNAFSDAERKDINDCTGYRSAAKLGRTRAAAPGAKAFWGNWASTFDTFEADTMTDLRAFARQEVVNRNYTGTALDTDVERMCAETEFDDFVDALFEMTSTSAFDSYGALVGHVAVCDGISDAFRILCCVEGIECIKVSGIGKTEAHAWNKVKIGDSWYTVDATWNKAADCVLHRYFLVPDSVISSNHIEKIGEDACVETLALAEGYNYYRDTVLHGVDLYTEDVDEFKSTFKTLYAGGETTIELYVASVPTEAAVKKALSDGINELHVLGGVTYIISYSDGYALIVF